jgi:hypothetical protein
MPNAMLGLLLGSFGDKISGRQHQALRELDIGTSNELRSLFRHH